MLSPSISDGSIEQASDNLKTEFAREGVSRTQESMVSPTSISDMETYYDSSTGFTYAGDANTWYYCYDANTGERLFTYEGYGAVIVGYDGSKGKSVAVPNKIAGLDVILVELEENNQPILSLDASSCPTLGALVITPGSTLDVRVESLNVKGCSYLKKLYCYGQNIASLDISDNKRLLTLRCSNNRISDTTALERWLSTAGHEGSVLPQRSNNIFSDGGSGEFTRPSFRFPRVSERAGRQTTMGCGNGNRT